MGLFLTAWFKASHCGGANFLAITLAVGVSMTFRPSRGAIATLLAAG